MSEADARRPVFVPPGTGRVLDDLGVRHKLTSAQTGGAYILFESTFGPGDGNRLHVHRREDEIGYVLEGALEVRLQAGTRRLEAGGIARLPSGIPHALRNPLTVASRYLFLAVPGGLDQWFDAVTAANLDGTMDEALFEGLSEAFGVGWLESSAPPSRNAGDGGDERVL